MFDMKAILDALPCPIGSDCWWVDDDTMEVKCEKGGITGFVIHKDELLALDACGERVEIHSQWCCFSKEEAEAFREKLLKESLLTREAGMTREEAISYFEGHLEHMEKPPVHLGSAVAVEEWAKRVYHMTGACRWAIAALREQEK